MSSKFNKLFDMHPIDEVEEAIEYFKERGVDLRVKDSADSAGIFGHFYDFYIGGESETVVFYLHLENKSFYRDGSFIKRSIFNLYTDLFPLHAKI